MILSNQITVQVNTLMNLAVPLLNSNSDLGFFLLQYFESNQGSSRKPFTIYTDEVHSDPEINDLIYAKIDEILSPASRMNVCFTSNSSINISSFNVS